MFFFFFFKVSRVFCVYGCSPEPRGTASNRTRLWNPSQSPEARTNLHQQLLQVLTLGMTVEFSFHVISFNSLERNGANVHFPTGTAFLRCPGHVFPFRFIIKRRPFGSPEPVAEGQCRQSRREGSLASLPPGGGFQRTRTSAPTRQATRKQDTVNRAKP